MTERLIAALLTGSVKLLTGAQCQWIGCGPYPSHRIYCANHSSHLDFVLLWSALPPSLRLRTRPVAAADYWFRGRLRRYLMQRVFNGIGVERNLNMVVCDPLKPMLDALRAGASLIIFPEGTRGSGEQVQPFKPGIYHLAKANPTVDVVPVWMENSYRVMPKGSFLPVPLLCSVRFGTPLTLQPEESRAEFLGRLKAAIEMLGRL